MSDDEMLIIPPFVLNDHFDVTYDQNTGRLLLIWSNLNYFGKKTHYELHLTPPALIKLLSVLRELETTQGKNIAEKAKSNFVQ